MLNALYQYYERLSNGEADIPVVGFSQEKISYILILSKDGQLVDIISHLSDEKNPRPKPMCVPMPEKKASSIKPNFLWDKTSYVLGVSLPKDKNSTSKWEYSLQRFEAFKGFHLKNLEKQTDVGLNALKIFLENWQPEKFAYYNCKLEMLDTNLVFRLDGAKEYLHETQAAKQIWNNLSISDDSSKHAMCLITGITAPVARLHPSIKGVSGGQSAGVTVVSFNQDAFTSYGKKQGNNSPISENAAFAYTTALNYLLRQENKQKVELGNITLIFWAQTEQIQQAQYAESLFANIMGIRSTDESETAKLSAEFEKITKGYPLAEITPDLDAQTQFFILGVVPNAARLSIRFFLQANFGEIQQQFAEHFRDLELTPQSDKIPPSFLRLLIELSPNGKSLKDRYENIPTNLASEMIRSILIGSRYPQALLAKLLIRLRRDGDISSLRVAMIKAILSRDFRKNLIKEEIPVMLDENNTQPAYLLGRLFALLANIQQYALGKELNASIIDKYYASASAIPYSVYPRLLSGSKHHLSKIRKDNPGLAINFDKSITTIMSKLPIEFPQHFSLENQGRFAIGFYHQKSKYFTKNEAILTTEGE